MRFSARRALPTPAGAPADSPAGPEERCTAPAWARADTLVDSNPGRLEASRAAYARRKGIVEPVFGQIKQGLGFRQFLLRGLAKMRGEWRLVCTVHNLLKLWRRTVVAAG